MNLKSFFYNCEFLIGISDISQIKSYNIPEIAFAGRSNVGKSSLINAVVGKKNCARVSKTPGRTQQINFFDIKNKLLLVDLPGYGYAQVSKSARKSWEDLIINYLHSSAYLRRVFLLVDSRHGLKPNDMQLMNIFEQFAIVYQIILTKVDKVSPKLSCKEQILHEISHRASAYPTLLPASSRTNFGIDAIRAEIAQLLKE